MVAPQGRTSISQEHARIRFLRLIRDFAPSEDLAEGLANAGVSGENPARVVLDHLAGDPLDRYQKASAELQRNEELDRYRELLAQLPGEDRFDRLREVFAQTPEEDKLDRCREMFAQFQNEEEPDRYPEAFARLQEVEELETRLLLHLGEWEVEELAETQAMRASIASWARRWHLDAPWCKRAALETLDEWYRCPRLLNERRWSLPSSGVYSRPPFRFETDGWSPDSGEPEVAARERMRTEFENRLRAHLEETRATAEGSTYLSATTRHPSRAFEYLVCFLVLELPFSRIADVYDVDHETAVPRSIRKLAEFLGLPLRDSPRGRPPQRSQT